MSICSVVLFLIQKGYQLYILKMNLTRKDQLLCTEIYTVVNVTNFVIAKHMTTWRRQETKYFQRTVLYHVFFTLTKVLIGCTHVMPVICNWVMILSTCVHCNVTVFSLYAILFLVTVALWDGWNLLHNSIIFGQLNHIKC